MDPRSILAGLIIGLVFGGGVTYAFILSMGEPDSPGPQGERGPKGEKGDPSFHITHHVNVYWDQQGVRVGEKGELSFSWGLNSGPGGLTCYPESAEPGEYIVLLGERQTRSR